MSLTFENRYVIGLVVFMVTLLFCKNVLECVNACMQVWQSCVCHDFFFCPCVHYGHAELLRHTFLALMLVFSVGQPIFLVSAKKITESILGRESFWTVNLLYLEFNASAFSHNRGLTRSVAAPVQVSDIRVSSPSQMFFFTTAETDGLLVVMPFTLAAACTTWMWISLRQASSFDQDPEWGPDLFADPRMQIYELLYSLEVFCMLCAFLSLVADPAPIEHTFVFAMVLSFLLLFFCAQSRKNNTTNQTEQTISMVLFSILSTLVSFYVVQHWSGSCATKRSSGLMLVLVLPVLAICHMSTTEATRAGTVILLRTCVSCLCSLYFLLLATLNPNSWC